MRIGIIGSGIEVYCCAHRLLDLDQDLDIQIFDEKAESGMYGEEPGIFEKWPLTPGPWFGEMFSQTPTPESSAVRYSWFVKALSIMLGKRGATIHLKSRVKKIENKNIYFSGAGISGTGQIEVETIIDFRKEKLGKKWYGVISNERVGKGFSGTRSDKTIENWSSKKELGENFIQRMQWYGENPVKALSERVMRGIEAAESTII
tara:strand:+ start:3028 stop:3639 length:612 start_codon:yes stop_codon:yes gene_type:complete